MKIEAASFLAYLSENLGFLMATCVPLWHPLGFVSCVIKESKGDHLVRVHYWPSGERRVKNPDWPIHTHSYHLSSCVLSGIVRDVQYRRVPGSKQLYAVKYFEGGSEILRVNETTGVEVTINEERKAGEQYEVPRGVFHETRVRIRDTAITLVALSDFGDGPPLVLGGAGQERYPYERISYDRDEFWREAKKALPSMQP